MEIERLMFFLVYSSTSSVFICWMENLDFFLAAPLFRRTDVAVLEKAVGKNSLLSCSSSANKHLTIEYISTVTLGIQLDSHSMYSLLHDHQMNFTHRML